MTPKPKEQSFRELVQNFVMGVEFYVRTDGKRGHSPEKATEYIISNLQNRLERAKPKEKEFSKGIRVLAEAYGIDHIALAQGHKHGVEDFEAAIRRELE